MHGPVGQLPKQETHFRHEYLAELAYHSGMRGIAVKPVSSLRPSHCGVFLVKIDELKAES